MRFQFELSEARATHLKDLIRECGLDNQKELFNSALTLFEWAVNERRKGRMIASVDEENQKFKELVMPALEAIQLAHHDD